MASVTGPEAAKQAQIMILPPPYHIDGMCQSYMDNMTSLFLVLESASASATAIKCIQSIRYQGPTRLLSVELLRPNKHFRFLPVFV